MVEPGDGNILLDLPAVMRTSTKLLMPRTDGERAEAPAPKSIIGNKLFHNGLPETVTISFKSLRHPDRGTT
jgi:hypothetical protein